MFDSPQQHLQQHYQLNLQLPLAAIIKIPSGNQAQEASYKNLICTDEDKAKIFEVIVTLAENSKFGLLMKQNHLRQLGIQINHVHPFKFLATIFSNPRLKMGMVNIFDDYFKRNGFMDGLGPSLAREASKGKLLQYISEFATEVNVDPTSLREVYSHDTWNGVDQESHDWEKLVRFLIEA